MRSRLISPVREEAHRTGWEDSGRGPSASRGRLAWAATYLAMTTMLLLPAIWNGFPFIFSDTGGYFSRPFEGSLVLGRSALYGSFIATGIRFDFWPAIIVQALLCAWLVRLVLRVQGFGRPVTALAVTAALCVGTSLPFYADQLMPDVFLPLAVMAFYLLGFASARLRRWEIAGLITLVAFASTTHMSIYAMTILLLVLFALLWAMMPASSPLRSRAGLCALSVAAGTVLALGSNYATAGTATFTPGGSTFLFARLLKDGFVKHYLDRQCPDPTLSLCAYRNILPASADEWLWGWGSPLYKLGGWQAFTPEANRIIVGSIEEEPGAQLWAVVKDTLAQVVTVATGEGFRDKSNWHTEWELKNYAPQSLPRFYAAGQQHDAIDFAAINLLQIPLALAATLSLPLLIALCWRCRATAAALALSIFAGLVANAAVCATFSSLGNRYQSRIVSIAVLAAGLAAYQWLKAWRRRRIARGTSHVTHQAAKARLTGLPSPRA